jgi:hypothetical protein
MAGAVVVNLKTPGKITLATTECGDAKDEARMRRRSLHPTSNNVITMNLISGQDI